MKSGKGNSLHVFATVALMTIIAAVPVCAQSPQPTTKPHRATSSATSPSSQASDASAGPNTQDLPILGKGTTNFIPLWTGSYTIGNSLLSQTGNGLIVGFYYDTTSHSFELKAGVFTNIDPPGALCGDAEAINDGGQIVGFYSSTDSSCDTGQQGYLLSGGSYMTGLSTKEEANRKRLSANTS